MADDVRVETALDHRRLSAYRFRGIDQASRAVLGPDFRSCSRESFDCADHVLPLRHVSVGEHLHAAGFTVTSVVPRFPPFSFWDVPAPLPALIRASLALPLAWWLLGTQLLVLATVER